MANKVLIISPEHDNGGVGKYTTELCSNLTIESVRTRINPSNPTVSQVFSSCKKILFGRYPITHLQYLYFGSYGAMTIPILLCCMVHKLIYRNNVFVTAHELWGEETRSSSPKLIGSMYIWMYHSLVALSTTEIIFLNERTEQEWHGMNPSSAVLSHEVKKVDRMDTEEARDMIDVNDSDLIILPGYLSKRKNYQLFMEIARNFPDKKFVITGGPRTDNATDIKQKIESDKPSNVSLTGRLEPDVFHAWFDAADTVLLPYRHTWQSGIFNLCASHECAVLSSDIDYFASIKEQYNCLKTFEQDSVEQASKKLGRLLENPQEQERLGLKISEYASDRSFIDIVQKHETMYDLDK